MRSTIKKFGLAALLLTFFVGCVQPPAPVNSDFEVSDEEGNTVTTQAVPTNGLKGDYYDNIDFTGTMKTRYDATVNRNPGTAAPITGIQPTTYSVRWTGQIMPAFPETYTFTLSYADGARLMINGQVLVNDWVDGAKRTKTGTVVLQANTKYDIRLEYYRNATNLGTIKLEWQSPSRTKQVVPKTSLFPVGSNLDRALAIVKVKANISANLTESFVILAQTGDMTLFAPEAGSRNFFFGVIDDQSLMTLYKLDRNNTVLRMTDVINKSSIEIGEVGAFVNADGSQSQTQRANLQAKIAAFIAGQTSAGILRVQAGTIRPQAVTDDIVCPVVFALLPKPVAPVCKNGTCQSEADKYVKTLCTISSIPERVFSAVVAVGGAVAAATVPGVGWVVGGTIIAIVVVDNSDLVGDAIVGGLTRDPVGSFDVVARWAQYRKCVTVTNPERCLLQLTPMPVNERKEVNSSGVVDPGVRNSGVENDTKSPVGVVISKREFVPDPNSASSFTPVVFPIDLNNYILPGDTNSFPVIYTCPATPTTLRGTAKFYHDANTLKDLLGQPIATSSPLEVLVVIECYGAPKISVSPSSISLEAGLNAYSDRGFFSVTNTGNSDLKITGIGPDTTWVSIERYSAEALTSTPIAPGQTRYIGFTFTCGPLIETRTAKISIFHDDLTSPRPMIVDARINCITSPILITMGGTDFWQKGGCQSSYCFNPPPFEGDTETTYAIKNNGSVPVSFIMNNLRGYFIRLDGINQYEAVGAYMTLQPGEERNYRLLFLESCFNVGYARYDIVVKPEVWRRVDVFDFSKVIILLAPQYVIHCNDR